MQRFDLIVIGGGPGGYVAAIRAAQLGLTTAIIEKEPVLGGTCVRVGCIPSKALLESSERYAEAREALAQHGVKVGSVELDLATMLKRKDEVVRANTTGLDFLFKKNKITRLQGHGTIVGGGRDGYQVALNKADGGGDMVAAGKLIIATGSKSTPLKGVELDYDRIGTSTEGLTFSEVPQHLVVIGAGYIGLELGSVWRRLGSKVTVLEYLERILPGMDSELADAALKLFKKQGLEFRLGARVTAARVAQPAAAAAGDGKKLKIENRKSRVDDGAGKCVVEISDSDPVECDRVLLAVGRIPNTDNLGLESIGLKTDERGRVQVNEHFETSAAGVYAIGDVIRGPMLAHKAEDEGMACVEHIVTGYGHVNYDAIPGIVYTHPEIATVGQSEDDLKSQQVPYRKGVFQFRGNGRARALAQTDGFVKVLAHKETDRVLGVHIIGPRAGDLIAEATTAIEFGASSEDIARCCHAHPTLSEALREAALAVDGRAIHA